MISIDWTFLVQFTNFVVLMVILNVLLYRPLRNVMAQRKEGIEAKHQRARDLEVSINEKMERYEKSLHAAKVDAGQAATLIRKEAAKREATILGSARMEASGHLDLIKAQVAKQAEAARSGLKNETQVLAAAIAGKVLGRKVK
ncbi:MAG: ATP synthase F0 subunit B [Desulfuromonadaceae bacterium]|nr:ATP synthase F0 subunit B [Desulfuromonas sp.]MDY0184912.1 ATP synthase F0 subunit B [Desulfuromonadaceae bacterium]